MSGTADVQLLLEGTYPFVKGGVSAWLHQLVTSLPEISFSIVYIGASVDRRAAPAYPMPPNVVHLTVHDLAVPPSDGRGGAPSAETLAHSDELHEWFRTPGVPLPAAALDGATGALGRPGGLAWREFTAGESTWVRIRDEYRRRCAGTSFVDYVWTVRGMHGPLYGLAEAAAALPPARLYHAVSTGYAGFLGMLLARRTGRPFVLTEHGIYTKERRIELASADWIRDEASGHPEGELGYARQLWVRFFEGLGRAAYESAGAIVSLYEGNRARQIADGADPARTRVIPNGIAVRRFLAARERNGEGPRARIAFVGRVVPIKDVKTFVRAVRVVADALPAVEALIVGPTEEDPAYYRECRELAGALHLDGALRFVPFSRPEEILEGVSVLVLTSISEALPLVVLEAFASGVPVVCTDVGACRELVEGAAAEDRALGAAGAVVAIGDPAATGGAVLRLLRDPARWRSARAAAIARVERHYGEEEMLQAYRELYRPGATWEG